MSKDLKANSYKFIVTGDSISKGVIYDDIKGKYRVLENNYVSILQNKLKGMVQNTARFGNTLIKGVGRLKHDVENENPDIVLIEYGGNDCDFNWNEIADDPEREHSPKTDFHLFEQMLKETIQFLKNNKIIPVLMTLPPLNAERYFKWVSKSDPNAEQNILQWLGSVTKIYWWQERYNSMVIKVAEETRTKWIDIRGAFLQDPDYSKYLCVDGIHPNEAGHRIIADKVLEYVGSRYAYLLKEGAGPAPA
ncbi:SGNH/GDSL hydrolase family protein [Gorillibacterium sp. sgz500922]|uniref:SGNH/GDSL hydrolase family protein n=1 Tax=Gorillibacterium sp. sgz500922 TaxID=3446694 RepID=UPI003F679F72